MRIRPENTTRKVDTLGRVTIPKSLRDRMRIKENDDLELFTMEDEGREYICMSAVDAIPARYIVAVDVLNELGVAVPEELEVKMGLRD